MIAVVQILEGNTDVLIASMPAYYMDDDWEMELLPSDMDKPMRTISGADAAAAHERQWQRPPAPDQYYRTWSSSSFLSSDRSSSAASTSIFNMNTSMKKKPADSYDEGTSFLNPYMYTENLWSSERPM
jgi:hypothetical protein